MTDATIKKKSKINLAEGYLRKDLVLIDSFQPKRWNKNYMLAPGLPRRT